MTPLSRAEQATPSPMLPTFQFDRARDCDINVVAIVQARFGSTRLPGKVLLDLAGEPMLKRVIHRVRLARRVRQVIVATTTESRDDELEKLCQIQGWPCFRGSENDVLDRYYQTARAFSAEAIVRITSDCPLIEPTVIDRVIEEFQRPPAVDYASNVIAPRTYPRGLDTEVLSFPTLERIWRDARDPAWREHVTAMVHQQPELFRTRDICSDTDWSHLRWTVDTPDDLELLRRIYRHFGDANFSWIEVLSLLATNPEWSTINQAILQKTV